MRNQTRRRKCYVGIKRDEARYIYILYAPQGVIIYKKWVREKETDCYCPIDGSSVVVGMNIIGICPGELVGQFYYKGCDLIIEPFETSDNRTCDTCRYDREDDCAEPAFVRNGGRRATCNGGTKWRAKLNKQKGN